MDALNDVDWAGHWAQLVQASRADRDGSHGIFDRVASNYAFGLADNPDLLLRVVEPFLDPSKTLVDVGAGTGRHVVPLSGRLAGLVAVEPSAGMRAHIPALPNLVVVPSTWEQAEVAPAELVISSHVLYGVENVLPFIEKMERTAKERVFVYLRDGPHRHPADLLYAYLTGKQRPRRPQLSDLFNLLRQHGRVLDLTMSRDPWRHRYASMETAIADCRERVGDGWDEITGRRWLEEHLVHQPDGSLTLDRGDTPEGILHWAPGR